MSTILLSADRVREGQPVQTEIAASYQDTGHGLPFLVVLSDWSVRNREYRRKTVFRCEEVPTPLGRWFLLHRPEADIAADGPDADTFYGVLVAANGQHHTCTCRGFQSRSRCRHFDSVRSLLEAGHIDHPGERPAEAEPTGPAPF
jgi:hypothetical protein